MTTYELLTKPPFWQAFLFGVFVGVNLGLLIGSTALIGLQRKRSKS